MSIVSLYFCIFEIPIGANVGNRGNMRHAGALSACHKTGIQFLS
jgi:hypothetical protein